METASLLKHAWMARNAIDNEELWGDLDPGIAPWVMLLIMHGVETCQSCQGASSCDDKEPSSLRNDGGSHCYMEPTIDFLGSEGAGFEALAIAMTHGLPVKALRRCWSASDQLANGSVWQLTFRRRATAEDAKSVRGMIESAKGRRKLLLGEALEVKSTKGWWEVVDIVDLDELEEHLVTPHEDCDQCRAWAATGLLGTDKVRLIIAELRERRAEMRSAIYARALRRAEPASGEQPTGTEG